MLGVEGFNAVQDQVEGELELGLVVTTGDARPGVHVGSCFGDGGEVGVSCGQYGLLRSALAAYMTSST